MIFVRCAYTYQKVTLDLIKGEEPTQSDERIWLHGRLDSWNLHQRTTCVHRGKFDTYAETISLSNFSCPFYLISRYLYTISIINMKYLEFKPGGTKIVTGGCVANRSVRT